MPLYRRLGWGRNQEVPSEDPTHAERYARNVVQGMQGNHSKYAMVGATCVSVGLPSDGISGSHTHTK